MTRENWTAMIESSLLPDFVITLDDESAPENYLLERFTNIHNLPLESEDQDETSKEVNNVDMWFNVSLL